jgi:hypothetical protein
LPLPDVDVGREEIPVKTVARIACAVSTALLAAACSPGDEERLDASEFNEPAEPVLNAMRTPVEDLTAEDLMDSEQPAPAGDEPVASDSKPAVAAPPPPARKAEPEPDAPAPVRRTPPAPAPAPTPPAEDPHEGHDMNSM